jgi:hydrogenase maturation protease
VVKAPILIVAIGNPSRGDDALGPMLLERIENAYPAEQIECIGDFQLQVEYVLDLLERRLVIFIDAAVNQSEAYRLSPLQAQADHSYSSHAISPAALLAAYRSTLQAEPPPSMLLAIKGKSFELGQPLSSEAQQHLSQAEQGLRAFIAHRLSPQ